jgi:hypothetical protein
MHIVDDRGTAIASPLTACFQLPLRTDCQPAAVLETIAAPKEFLALTIEGDAYGPTSIQRAEEKPQPDGSLRVVVPRKADLTVAAPGRQQALTVSLYSPLDNTFREPAFRRKLEPSEANVKVPAGTFILSLSEPGDAPDLGRLSTRPGEPARVVYHSRQGWSLIARCMEASGGHILAGTRVSLAATEGFGQKDHPLSVATSEADGLVLFSGVGARLGSLTAAHTGLLAAQSAGLTAAPGSFAFREVRLAAGGRLRAQVSVHGRVLAQARCALSSPAAIPSPHQTYQEQWSGKADAQGVCSSGPLPAGFYKLSIQAPEGVGQASRWVSLQEAQRTEVDVALAPTRVTGVVKKGQQPAAQYSVLAFEQHADRPRGAMLDAAATCLTGDDGKYELTVWSPGTYMLNLKSAAGRSVPSYKTLLAVGDDDQTIDFNLSAATVQGTVVDPDGKPVALAQVVVTGWSSSLLVPTDANGQFSLDAPGPGSGDAQARKRGYRPSDSAHFQVGDTDDAAVPPMTLVLQRGTSGLGTVQNAAGAPVPGALVISLATTPQGPKAYALTHAEADGTFEVDLPPGPAQALVSGPGCPLFFAALSAARLVAGNEEGGATDQGSASMPPASTGMVIQCPSQPATIELTLQDDAGNPVPNIPMILRWNGAVIPETALAAHLQALGLSSETDGMGRLVIAGISPGAYDLFAATRVSDAMVFQGLQIGYLTSVTLPPLDYAGLQLILPHQPPRDAR